MFRFMLVWVLACGASLSDQALAQHNHAPGEHCPECESKMGFGHAPGSCDWGADAAELKVPNEAPSFTPPQMPVETDSLALSVLLFSAMLTIVMLTIRHLQKRGQALTD